MNSDQRKLKAAAAWNFRLAVLIPALTVANASFASRFLWLAIVGSWLLLTTLTAKTNHEPKEQKLPKKQNTMPAKVYFWITTTALLLSLSLSAISWDTSDAIHFHKLVCMVADFGTHNLTPIHAMVTSIPSENVDRVIASFTLGYIYFGLMTLLYFAGFFLLLYQGKILMLRNTMAKEFPGAKVLLLPVLLLISVLTIYNGWFQGPWINISGSKARAFCVSAQCFAFSDLGLIWATFFRCVVFFGFGPLGALVSMIGMPLLFRQPNT